MRDQVLGKKDPAFDSFCALFFDMCAPTTWRFVLGTFVELWTDPDSKEMCVVIIKRFPNVYLSAKEGVNAMFGDVVRKFVDACKPLSVSVQHLPFEEIARMLEELPKQDGIVMRHEA
jgi:hypothetical protein